MQLLIGGEYLVPEVSVYNETSLAQHETDQSKSCLCPESSLDDEEIKKKLMDYNRDLNHPNYFSFIRIIHETSKSKRRLTKELEELIPCLLTPELLPYLHIFLICYACSYVQLIFHHVLAELDYPAREHFGGIFHNTRYHHDHLEYYFDLFYDNTNKEVSFDLIHKVWKYHPRIEFTLRLLYCKRLMENKQYDILNQLIRNNEEYFFSVTKKSLRDLATYSFNKSENDVIYLTLLLILVCNYVTSRQIEKVKTVLMFIEHIFECPQDPDDTLSYISEGCEYFTLLTLKLKQSRLIPSFIKVLLNRPVLHYLSLKIISICYERLLKDNCLKESMDFIKDNSHFILNVPFFLEGRKCVERQKLCILLLSLLHVYVTCDDLINMNHVLNRLQEFRQSLLSSTYKSCACFMGKNGCSFAKVSLRYGIVSVKNLRNENRKIFKSSLLSLEINNLRDRVIKKQMKPIQYLKHMKDAVGKFLDSREILIEEFALFIEQMSLHNETGLYDIIKTLRDLEMKPEIQDIFIQGLTDYIHEKCNKQNNIYLSLLLDINMTCYKGEFLTKLTIKMGKLLLLDVDTANDVEKIIYRCFCKLRHENKETDIAKYQIHFTFISAMDAEEKMSKMSNLRCFLHMLTLLMLSSGSQHKSAKLKKFLSLKYAYEDAILYLLWCSGDVEINPGPTLKKLRPQADSVKERNWIHEMCTTSLKLLKNKALDSKTDGLRKEKPDSWQELYGDKPLFDPRNKPEGKQYSIKNDKELLNCLFNCCDRMSIKFPCNLQREINAWKSDKELLLELYVSRQEIEAMKMAKDLLIKYADTPEFKKYMKDNDVGISFNQNSTQKGSSKGYSDVVRDLAITFCRVSKGLPIFEKNDGMWKTPPCDWNSNDLYSSPCNTAKRHKKHQDQQLVDDLLSYCEKKSISIPPALQPVVNAWKLKKECKLEKSREICKHYTIWSSLAIIQHSIKYLEIEGLLETPHVQQSLKQIGVSLHCEKDPKHLHSKSTVTTKNESKVSGLSSQYSSISDNHRGIHLSSSSSLASDSDILCSQHSYEAKASTNSQIMKSVTKCSKLDFQNQPSTSGCTIYSTLVPCPDNRVDLQSTDVRDLSDSHTILSEISCQEPDFQPSSSGCSTFTNRAEYVNVRESIPHTERIQKRRRASGEDRSDKRPRLHSGNEFIQDTDSSNDQLFGPEDEIPNSLLQYLDNYIRCDNLEDLEDLERQLKLLETI